MPVIAEMYLRLKMSENLNLQKHKRKHFLQWLQNALLFLVTFSFFRGSAIPFLYSTNKRNITETCFLKRNFINTLSSFCSFKPQAKSNNHPLASFVIRFARCSLTAENLLETGAGNCTARLAHRNLGNSKQKHSVCYKQGRIPPHKAPAGYIKHILVIK